MQERATPTVRWVKTPRCTPGTRADIGPCEPGRSTREEDGGSIVRRLAGETLKRPRSPGVAISKHGPDMVRELGPAEGSNPLEPSRRFAESAFACLLTELGAVGPTAAARMGSGSETGMRGRLAERSRPSFAVVGLAAVKPQECCDERLTAWGEDSSPGSARSKASKMSKRQRRNQPELGSRRDASVERTRPLRHRRSDASQSWHALEGTKTP